MRMLLEHEWNYGLGMDDLSLVIALAGTRTELWFGHRCSGEPRLVGVLFDYWRFLSLYSGRRGIGRLLLKSGTRQGL